MIKVSTLVKQSIHRSPVLSELLASGLGNLTKIAEHIQPMIERERMEPVSTNALVMSLSRLQKGYRSQWVGAQYIKHVTEVSVRSHLNQYLFPINKKNTAELYEYVLKINEEDAGQFINVTLASRQGMLVISENYHADVEEIFGSNLTLNQSQLHLITMQLPFDSLMVPGVYYPILRALAWEGINFVEVVSVDTEFGILFEDDFVEQAFAVIKRLTKSET